MPPSKAQLRFERVFAGRTRPVPSELGETHITETQIDFTRVAQNNGLRTSASDTGTAQQIDSISASLRAEPRAEEVSNFEKTATCVHDGTAAELQQGRNTSSTTTVVDDRIVKDMAFRTYSEPVSSSTELVGRFCLFNQVVKFNRQYMDDSDDRVRQEFFAGKQIYARNWDIYNISTPDVLANQSILLVPFHQVELLVDDIRKRFAVSDLTVPGYPFTINFFNDNAPKPSFLGTCNAEADISDLKAKVEAVPWGYGEMSINASEAERSDLETFMMKCRDMLSVDDRKNKTTKKKKEKRRVRTMEGDLSTLQRAQEYLGLRPASMTRSSASLAQTPVVDLTKPSPYPPHREPVLISVDVESYERDHSLITEIGVSTLDTRDLHDLAPGETGDNWTQKIRSRHFRIKDREHYVNYQYCIGDAGKFLFGKSEFISIAEAGVVIDSCFQPPFSAAFTCSHSLQLDNKDNPDTQITNLPERSSALVQALQTPTTTTTTPSEPRTILLIGHDLTADTTYLSSLSSKVFRSYPPSSEDNAASTSTSTLLTGTLDTATLHKQLTHASQPRSLTVICHDLDITPWHAHNAGNDARYTLEVFLKIALKASQQQHKPDSSYRKRDRQRDRKSTQNNTREGGGLDTGTIAVSSMQTPSSMKGASSMTSHANTLGENTRVHTTDRRNDRAQITSDVTIESDDNKRNNIANNDRSARVEQQQQQHHQEQLQEQNDEPARYRDPASDEEPY